MDVPFPTGRDSETFRDKAKGTEVPLLSRDKGTTGKAQNLAKGRDRLGQPVKILDGTRDGTIQDFDCLSHPVPWDKTEQSRKGGTVKLGNKEQIGIKELFMDYQPFYTINLLLDKELLPI